MLVLLHVGAGLIRVGFSRSRGPLAIVSWAIRKFTGRPYSHVWLVFDGEDCVRGVPLVLEANFKGGLHFVPFIGYECNKVIVKVVTPPIPLDNGATSLMHRLGTGYDFPGLLGEGWRIMWREWFQRKVHNPLASPRQMWCSEAVAYAMQQCEYPNMKPDDWQRCTPADIETLLNGEPLP